MSPSPVAVVLGPEFSTLTLSPENNNNNNNNNNNDDDDDDDDDNNNNNNHNITITCRCNILTAEYMPLKDTDGIANSEDPDQTVPLGAI